MRDEHTILTSSPFDLSCVNSQVSLCFIGAGLNDDDDSNSSFSYNESRVGLLGLPDWVDAKSVLYWNAPLAQFENRPQINISDSSGASVEAGGPVIVAGKPCAVSSMSTAATGLAEPDLIFCDNSFCPASHHHLPMICSESDAPHLHRMHCAAP